MSAESRLILSAVRSRGTAEMANAAADVQDWDLVANVAEEHRVTGYVLPAVREAAPAAAVSAAIKMQDSMFLRAAEVARLDSELGRAVGALRAAGVSVLVLKGPALARTVYPSPYLRPYMDIDLAISSPDVGKACDALEGAGFQRILEPGREETDEGSPCSSCFHLQFQAVVSKALIEIHSDPLQLGLLPVCESGRWSRAQPLPHVDGALMLAPCDQVVHLAVHAHRHGYNRLIWLKDLDLLARSSLGIDWDLVVSTALREGVNGPVWYALSITKRLLQTPLPPDAVARLAPSLPMRAIYARIWSFNHLAALEGQSHWRAVQFDPGSLRGMLPSLVLLGRRGHRGRAMLNAIRAGVGS